MQEIIIITKINGIPIGTDPKGNYYEWIDGEWHNRSDLNEPVDELYEILERVKKARDPNDDTTLNIYDTIETIVKYLLEES